MNREDTKKIIAVISATYPNFKIENPTTLIDSWTMCLADFDYQQVQTALVSFIRTKNSAFAPSVSELIGMIHRPQELAQMSDADAWVIVRKAISRGNYHADEDFAKFPVAIQRAVGSPSQLRVWARDEHFNDGVESSNFYKRYNTAVKQENEISWMPAEVRTQLENLQNRILLEVNDG